MKKSNKEYLKKYETNLYTAKYQDYSRNLPGSVLRHFEEIYYEETGINLNSNLTCSKCILTLLKKVADIYYA